MVKKLNSQAIRLCLVGIFLWVGHCVSAQSLAYKTLLSGLYDDDFPTLMPSEIKSLSDFQILDTRESEEFEVSHLEGAINVGYENFSISQLSQLDPKKPVLVYCTVGARSQDIGKKLAEQGFQVFNLYGGVFQWVNDGKEVYDQSGKTNRVHTYNLAWSIWLEKGEKVY